MTSDASALFQLLLDQNEALQERVTSQEKSRPASVISAHTALEGADDAVNAADSSQPGGLALSQLVLGPKAHIGGHPVGRDEGPQFGTSRGGGNGSMPTPESLEDPELAEVAFLRVIMLRVLSGPMPAARSGEVDERESAAVERGSAVRPGSVSGPQVWHTGSGSATFAGGNAVPSARVVDPANCS